MRVGIFTDYPSQAVLSGPAIHTSFLKENLEKRGHEVTLFGPNTHEDSFDGHPGQHLFKGIPYPTHPKTKIVMPWPLNNVLNPPRVDIIHGQINSHMMLYGGWMRKMWRIPMLNTHIIHLPTHSHFVVGDRLYKNEWVRHQLEEQALGQEKVMARFVNQGDGMIVQSRFMVDYWRERGVTVPIETVGRPINPAIFDLPRGEDPFPAEFAKGGRLIVVSRHDREKRLDELIQIFDQHIAPADENVTLTLIGDGAEHQHLVEQAARSRYANRILFPGEIGHEALVSWYGHADVFVYTSISETFGNVVNEALWCGLPCVAYDDRMGVAHQVTDQENGFLLAPDREDSHANFTKAVLTLLRDADLRLAMGQRAAARARATSHPDVVIDRFEAIYERAIQRCHDEIPVGLSERSRALQLAELSKATGEWAVMHGLLLGLAGFATKTGLGRPAVVEQIETRRRENTGLFQAIRERFDGELRDAAE